MEGYSETHKKALDKLRHIIRGLNNDLEFYEVDFGCEYSPFEEELKSYCDSYGEFYLKNNESKEFFDSLASIAEAIVGCNADEYYEDFFRPAELITYYFGKIISSDDDLKDGIHDWLDDFCREFEGDMLSEEYFRPFISGERIYHADEYYTGYNDFNKMISVFKQ